MDNAASGTAGNSGGIEPQQLEQLQGLHLPEAIGWWPLAPGWWILAVALLLMLSFGFVSAFKRRKFPKDDTRWLDQVNQCYDDWREHRQNTRYLHQINRLLRVQAVHLSGRRQVARLSGADWLHYLSKTTAVAQSEELQHLLSEACYQQNVNVNVDQVHPAVMQLATGLTHAHAIHPTAAMTMASVSR